MDARFQADRSIPDLPMPGGEGSRIISPIDVGECEENQDLARAGYTLTFRLARPPSNFTVPVTRANNV